MPEDVYDFMRVCTHRAKHRNGSRRWWSRADQSSFVRSIRRIFEWGNRRDYFGRDRASEGTVYFTRQVTTRIFAHFVPNGLYFYNEYFYSFTLYFIQCPSWKIFYCKVKRKNFRVFQLLFFILQVFIVLYERWSYDQKENNWFKKKVTTHSTNTLKFKVI